MGKYVLRGVVWMYGGTSSWYFVTLPSKDANRIKVSRKAPRTGWGSIPVSVTLGKTTWRTSLFPDSKSGSYVLPLKASVRKVEGIREGDVVQYTLWSLSM